MIQARDGIAPDHDVRRGRDAADQEVAVGYSGAIGEWTCDHKIDPQHAATGAVSPGFDRNVNRNSEHGTIRG